MVLVAVPGAARQALPWMLTVAMELFVARHCWNIDFIPDHVHAVSSAKWDLDPSGVGVFCQAPAETGKLVAAAFVVSVLAQLTVVLVVAAVAVRRARSDHFRAAQRRVGALVPEELDVPLEGVPEVAYAAHGVACFVFTGSVAARALNLYLRHKRRYRHCPHIKVLGIFKFAIIADLVLLVWYVTLAYTAFGMIAIEFFETRAARQGNDQRAESAPRTASGASSRRLASSSEDTSRKRD